MSLWEVVEACWAELTTSELLIFRAFFSAALNFFIIFSIDDDLFFSSFILNNPLCVRELAN